MNTRTPLLRSVVVSAISASWLATLTETRGHYQTAPTGWLLRGLLPGLELAQAYRRVGATAMIGKNDDAETLSLANAATLVAYARQQQLGLVSFWAIQRDQPCAPGATIDLCSRVNTAAFPFSAIFAGVTVTVTRGA